MESEKESIEPENQIFPDICIGSYQKQSDRLSRPFIRNHKEMESVRNPAMGNTEIPLFF